MVSLKKQQKRRSQVNPLFFNPKYVEFVSWKTGKGYVIEVVEYSIEEFIKKFLPQSSLSAQEKDLVANHYYEIGTCSEHSCLMEPYLIHPKNLLNTEKAITMKNGVILMSNYVTPRYFVTTRNIYDRETKLKLIGANPTQKITSTLFHQDGYLRIEDKKSHIELVRQDNYGVSYADQILRRLLGTAFCQVNNIPLILRKPIKVFEYKRVSDNDVSGLGFGILFYQETNSRVIGMSADKDVTEYDLEGFDFKVKRSLEENVLMTFIEELFEIHKGGGLVDIANSRIDNLVFSNDKFYLVDLETFLILPEEMTIEEKILRILLDFILCFLSRNKFLSEKDQRVIRKKLFYEGIKYYEGFKTDFDKKLLQEMESDPLINFYRQKLEDHFNKKIYWEKHKKLLSYVFGESLR